MVREGESSACYEAGLYPFGGERVITNTCPQNYKFEGKERDTGTGNDFFGARYFNSLQGRWLTPDWSARQEAVPYANLSSPQTFNLYAYVGNNPVTRTDADGHASDPGNNCVETSFCGTPGNQVESGSGVTSGDPTARQQAQQPQQPVNSLTVLSQQVAVTYASNLTPDQRLEASNKLTQAAALINAHADELSQAQKNAIGQVGWITVVGQNQASLGISGRNVTLSTSYLRASSVAWTASVFAHEGKHKLNSGKFTGNNAWRDEQIASRVQRRVGRVFGFSQTELDHLARWAADSNRVALQQHMESGLRY